MKSKFLSAVVTIMFTTVTLQCMAQPEPPKGPLKGPGPREAGVQPLQQVMAFTGTVNEWANNDDYIYDGFYLQTSAGKFLVKFPSHLGAQLVKSIKLGATVTVNGAEGINTTGVKEIKMVNIIANGQTITDTPPAATVTPVAETTVSGNGKITALKMDREGRVNGFIVDNKTILKTSPHTAAQLNSLLTSGSDISFTGIKKQANNGEAMAGSYSIVHCQTVTIKGTQYLTN